ncbi:glycoside hydrolase family 10 protein [Sinomicrobium weinanense]|uniref:Family 10 glycosylhydrolase n=1 Tax=Sinomicrobium weinanense TaxID=2842200 RepID=A0A926JST1_9FLAO|nr:family 10 glycosylhydrolase [Sinomicrobium weinanense]MBC9796536.1 family 10 glycosylhydrolase [Sinomicrobium weinanense]MBU3123552.1 family 10 glycosylhydrolase [Sinomicrobium weinanense]
MKRKSHKLPLLCLLSVLLAWSCKTHRSGTDGQGWARASIKLHPPVAEREFRAAWVATVANINWPSKPGLPVKEQQKEALELLDFLEAHHFNAVIFQVRPQADALYDSKIEPWSYFLTGKQGQAPEPYYDPLRFWIKAAHERGLELHAWLNPYRAHHVNGGEIGRASVVKTMPELVVKLKQGYWWFDPSRKETREHALAVVKDLVTRYDIDGIHFDDYFYPYPSYNNDEDFPDEESWKNYTQRGGRLSRADWRRGSVNTFVKEVYSTVKSEKPLVKFGISPFGIWRPGHPASVSGFDQYDILYADARLWLNKGWVDYFTPQLYWKINKEGQSFPVLLNWWKGENKKNRHLWPGIRADLGGGEQNTDEIINQIMITRGMLPESKGVVHWSIAPLLKYPELADGLLKGPYKKEALVPESPWLKKKRPDVPVVNWSSGNGKIKIKWSHPDEKEVFRWVVRYQYEDTEWNYKILPGKKRMFELDRFVNAEDTGKRKGIGHIAVTAVGRNGNESDFAMLAADDKTPTAGKNK